MSPALSIAETRHQQAVADLAAAEVALADAVAAAGIGLRPIRAKVSADPDAEVFTLPLVGFSWRVVEAAAEAEPYGPLGRAWSGWKRAQRAEKKAASALHRARLDEESRAEIRPAPKRHARSQVGRMKELARELHAMRQREAAAA